MKKIIFLIKIFSYMLFAEYKKLKYEKLKKQGMEEKAKDYLYTCVKKWSNFTLKSIGIKLDVTGLENVPKENCVFISNHQGFMDIPVILSAIDKPIGFIAKKELEKFPFVSYWMREIKCSFMDRSNIREAIKSINEGINALNEGQSMVIFPEGTRSKSRKLGEFKKGSMKLAIKSKKPIVPVILDGTYISFEESNSKNKHNIVKVVVGKPLYIKDLNKEDISKLNDIIRNIISEKLIEIS